MVSVKYIHDIAERSKRLQQGRQQRCYTARVRTWVPLLSCVTTRSTRFVLKSIIRKLKFLYEYLNYIGSWYENLKFAPPKITVLHGLNNYCLYVVLITLFVWNALPGYACTDSCGYASRHKKEGLVTHVLMSQILWNNGMELDLSP